MGWVLAQMRTLGKKLASIRDLKTMSVEARAMKACLTTIWLLQATAPQDQRQSIDPRLLAKFELS